MFGVDYFVIILSLFFTDVAMCRRSEIMRHIIRGKDEFPYLCSVAYKDDFVFACSILTMSVVIVSVSNMNQIPSSSSSSFGRKPRYYNDIRSLSVIVGSPYMNPTQFDTLPRGARQVNVTGFHTQELSITEQNDTDVDLTRYFKFEVFDTAPTINIGFLKIANPLQWSNQVQPLPLGITSKQLLAETEEVIEDLENPIYPVKACKIAGWHARSSRKIFHYVIYVPKPLCRNAYCGYNINACFDFINVSPQVCFKSAYWGGPCAKDTGSALFCTFFNGGNIFAILSTAINCEKENLPCVYTTMPKVLQDYQRFFGKL